MNLILRRVSSIALSLSAAGCASAVDVDNPGVIEGDHLDPILDGRMFSLSARQDFASAYGWLILLGAWSTGEAISAETVPWPSEFERRDVHADNSGLLSAWASLSVARASSERVVAGLEAAKGAVSNVDLARAALYAGYAYLHMAEAFCEGAVDGTQRLTTAEMLTRATSYFARALETGDLAATAGPAADQAEARAIALAARVGRARARLQGGARAGALSDAQAVPREFELVLWYSDNATGTLRLVNLLSYYTSARSVLSVAPAFRNLQDPRVLVSAPSSQFPPFDGVTPLWTQKKYPALTASIRLASGLEAKYIAAEAQESDPDMLSLIQERRASNGQPPYTGDMGASALLLELMNQRSRDFFLEGKRMGDARRRPGLLPGYPRTGDPYHKSGFAPVSTQACWPLPAQENGIATY